jgi:serine/threonine protein kinase
VELPGAAIVHDGSMDRAVGISGGVKDRPRWGMVRIFENIYNMFSAHNTASSLKNFAVLEKLGEGSFATVYKVQRIDDKNLYAMKKVTCALTQVKMGQMNEKERENALNEVRVLASISHSNVINYR